ncbi:MAG: CRISPR-associated helicase Cas3', partial [bacterium]
KNDYELYKENKPLYHIMKANIRHEFYSVLYGGFINLKNKIELINLITVATHHGKLYISNEPDYHFKLKNHSYNNRNFFDDYYKKIKKNIDIINKKQYHEKIKLGYEFAGPRAILQTVDKFASAIEGVELENISEEEKRRKINQLLPKKFNWSLPEEMKELRPIQKKLNEIEINNDIFLVRAATGSGKSFGSLLLGKRIIETIKVADRIIFTAPTMFTSNQIMKEFTGSLVYHSTANKLGKFNYNRLYSAKIFNNPITVVTVDHLLSTPTHQYEHHFPGSFNVANSVIIFDEIDFYDEYVFQNIKEFIKYYSVLGVKFILMSATFPDKILDYFSDFKNLKISKPIIDNTYDNNKKVKVLGFNQYDIQNVDTELSYLIPRIKKYKSAIFYNNTVATTKITYKFLRKNGLRPILYNSHFTIEDKNIIENTLIKNFGKNKTDFTHDVAVLSQIGELSINISAPYQISDICPGDRLVQRLGRLMRFLLHKMGHLDLLIPYYNDMEYLYPYQFMNDQHPEILETLLRTIDAFQNSVGKELTNKDLMNMVNYAYQNFNPNNFSKDSIRNKDNYVKLLEDNLILTHKKPQPTDLNEFLINDEIDTNNWRTRNFAPSNTILVHDFGDGEMVDKQTYLDVVNRKTISVNSNFHNNNVDNGNLKQITIIVNDTEKHITQINRLSDYNSEYGLHDKFYRVINN